MLRTPHVYTPFGSIRPPSTSWKEASRAMPMNGGVLTLGAYFVNITVGTGSGARNFNALVDTGSSNTAVPSIGCTTCGPQPQPGYNASASPTSSSLRCNDDFCQNCRSTSVGSSALPSDFNRSSCLYQPKMCSTEGQCGYGISYGGSSSAISGVISSDTICLDGSLCAPTFVYEITGQYPAGNLNTGILGLAFPANACNPTCQPTFMDDLITAKQLEPQQNLFGMCLTASNGGTLDMGFVDAAKYTGTIQYTAVVKKHWFNINVKDILLGSQSIGVPSFLYNIRNDAIGAFVDSGTAQVLVSPYAFQVIQSIFLSKNYSSLPGVKDLFSGNNCANLTPAQVAQYPSMDFVIEGMDGASDFSVSMTGSNYLMYSGQGSAYCLGIQGVPSVALILGDILMENYYIVFDRVGARMGFAPVKSCV